jgi:signal transduction histidine kinase
VSGRVASGDFVLEVRDDGLGFSETKAPAECRNGLRNMRARMEEIGGRFDAQSSADGTAITFTLPLPAARPAANTPATV